MDLSVNALKVLETRYLLKNESGKVIETPQAMCRRVADYIARPDDNYNHGSSYEGSREEFFRLISELDFVPNSPTLMNAGTPMKQLSACFVLPVEDSIEGIFDSLKHMALIHQSGGGTGFSFSRLRPKDDVVKSTGGVASGPVSFMRIFDQATEVVKQGGRRRGANMGLLRIDHPDIVEFINMKRNSQQLNNFNISVGVTDAFMEALANGENYNLISPRNHRAVQSLSAQEVFEHIVEAAWLNGDPGLIFLDEINRHNPTPQLGDIETTNPCGEQPLLPFESCNLGSINLPRMLKGKEIDWAKLERTVKTAVHFLDNVIEMNSFPLPEIKEQSNRTRKIGLGVMGFADFLIAREIPYASDEAIQDAEAVMKFIADKAKEKSIQLAEKRGPFPAYYGSRLEKMGVPPIRNATLTTIAPTGSISIIAQASSGIEPLFAISFIREILDGSQMLETNPLFVQAAKDAGYYSEELMLQIAETGTIQAIASIPEAHKKIFATALDISPTWHIKMQAAFQKYIDNAVSKTVNLPNCATRDHVKKLYLQAYNLKCKGITVFRYGSRDKQVLYMGKLNPENQVDYVKADAEESGGCQVCSLL